MSKQANWQVDFMRLIEDGDVTLAESGVPLYLQIAKILTRMIEQEELPAGARLPSEVAIAEAFSVSRIPVRQALSLLDKKGLVSRQRGRGTHVAANIPRTNTIELTGMAFEVNKANSLNEMVGIDQMPPPPRVLRFLAPTAADGISRICRRRIVNGVPFCFIETFIATELAERIDPVHFEHMTMIEVLEALGVQFGSVEQTLKAISPSTSVTNMLKITQMDPVMLVKITSSTPEDVPIHWSNIYYRGEMFQYRVSRH